MTAVSVEIHSITENIHKMVPFPVTVHLRIQITMVVIKQVIAVKGLEKEMKHMAYTLPSPKPPQCNYFTNHQTILYEIFLLILGH